jgi:hypothetical protein
VKGPTVRFITINDRDGGVGRRGPWWAQLVLPFGLTFAVAVRAGSNDMGWFDAIVIAWAIVYAVVVVGAHAWWLRHRRELNVPH